MQSHPALSLPPVGRRRRPSLFSLASSKIFLSGAWKDPSLWRLGHCTNAVNSDLKVEAYSWCQKSQASKHSHHQSQPSTCSSTASCSPDSLALCGSGSCFCRVSVKTLSISCCYTACSPPPVAPSPGDSEPGPQASSRR